MDIFYPFERIADFVSYNLLDLTASSHLWWAVNFFIYDTLKIFVILILITQIMSFINVIFPIQKIQLFLSKNKLFWLEYVFASLFWAITPFCSCSSTPLFIWFLKARIPLGVTFSFLITSPLINEVAIALFIGIFGRQTTLLYIAGGATLWVVWWWIITQLKLESQVADFIREIPPSMSEDETTKKSLWQIWRESTKEWRYITKQVLPYVVGGVAIGAAIHGFVPVWFFEQYLDEGTRYAVPLATIVGVPMYANATSIIPIIQSLIAKWIPLWTGIAFMMATVWLSLPEFLILKKVMKTKLLLIFFGIVTISIIALWYLYNIIL